MSSIVHYAYDTFFFALFLSGIITLMNGGALLFTIAGSSQTTDTLNHQYEDLASDAKPADFNSQDIIDDKKNPTAYDVISGMLNLPVILYRMLAFVFKVFANYLLLGPYLLAWNVPSIIVGLFVMGFQVWQMYWIARFMLKSDRV